jgi:hypothetical protein
MKLHPHVGSGESCRSDNFTDALTSTPSINYVSPRLKHDATLLTVFGLVVDRAHIAFFVSQALFNSVLVKTCFVQQSRGCSA